MSLSEGRGILALDVMKRKKEIVDQKKEKIKDYVEEKISTEEQKERPITKKEVKDYSSQTKTVIIAMIVLLASIVLVYWFAQEQKKFELDGVEFYRQKEGTVTFYNSLLGYVSSTGEQIPFILKLRINPERLAEVPVSGRIKILSEAVISLSPEVVNCSDTYITLFDMAMTLKAFGTKSTLGTPDREYAEESNFTLADCRNSLNQTVIIFKEGNATSIEMERIFFENCYIIEIKDCQIREGYERFIVRYITDSLINQN